MRNRGTLLFLLAALAPLVAAAASHAPALADKIVDPKTVAPEFREAAEKRKAEQIKLIEMQQCRADRKDSTTRYAQVCRGMFRQVGQYGSQTG